MSAEELQALKSIHGREAERERRLQPAEALQKRKFAPQAVRTVTI